MKKIIYSIATALLLSVILTLLIPKWLFKGDARWTYQNDAARVDVRFGGQLKNGCVNAAGADLQISQPAWLTGKSYQGTKVEFPVSYRIKSYQIKLTPRADKLGEDAVLVMELKGKDFQHRGKRRPAWVSFRNITLNGQLVAGEKVVWHNKPFVLKSPLRASEITLTFDICKPFAASDISFVHILVVFLAFLLLSLFIAHPRRTLDHALAFINRKDIVKVIFDGYQNINPVYRRSFWIIFGVLCFAFGFHTICFMWGHQDWHLFDRTQKWLAHAWEGRYMAYFIKVTLSNGVYLPLIYDLISFITMAINAVLLCKYWHLERRVTYCVLCGLVLTAQPFTLCMMYFVNMIPEVFIGVTCVLAALLLSEKIALDGVPKKKKIIHSLFAIILFHLSLAMYPVLINTIAVAFVGRLLVQSFDWDGSRQQLKSCLKTFTISAANIVLGIVLYKLVITHVFPVTRSYNTDTLPMAQVPERLGVLLKQCFRQLYEYNYPFISQWTLWVFLAAAIALILYICFVGNFKQKAVRLFFLFSSLFATQTAMIIAKTHMVDGRVELFGLVFFEVLVTMVILTRIRRLRNISVIAGACVIFASIINDLDCLRVCKLGFDTEKMLWNRILARLEIQKEFNPNKKYDIVPIGRPISTRLRYYAGSKEKFAGRVISLFESYESCFSPFRPDEFYYPTRFLGKSFSSHRDHKNDPEYMSRLKRLYQAGVLQKAEVWPKPNGLIVWKHIILFVTDGKELDNYRKRFERELGRQ